MEAALVFDAAGEPVYWHVPADRSSAALPDSHRLWQVLWENRARLGGVAHTHPWEGAATFSTTDVTTFAAVEDGLGRRLVWPVVTFTEVAYFGWTGPNRLDYSAADPEPRVRIPEASIEKLRALSR